ncbi:hypothetical protein KR026_009270, partial [Drosophila bipectinata]
KEHVAEKPKDSFPLIEEFFRLPKIYYRTIGLNPYESSKAEKNDPDILSRIQSVVFILNLVFVVVMEVVYIVISFRTGDNFLESCMVMSYIGFSFVGFSKIIVVIVQKEKMTSLFRTLESIFPKPLSAEEDPYDTRQYLRRCLRFTKGFGGLYTFLVFIYNFYPITQYKVLELMGSPNANPVLPYSITAPWDYRHGWDYYLNYFSEAVAGYTATCGHISADLMIFSVTTQVIMHFSRVIKAFREFDVGDPSNESGEKVKGADEALQELRSLVAYHHHILRCILKYFHLLVYPNSDLIIICRITDDVNDVFGIPLLINFAASSLLVCFVGFQMTFGVSPQHFAKLMLMLSSALVEIYLICSFSQRLIEASENVSSAVYEMNWTGADVRFRRMLIYIAHRSQKPVCLKATVFVDISIETMSIFLRMSYKFFCAIRTMYQ